MGRKIKNVSYSHISLLRLDWIPNCYEKDKELHIQNERERQSIDFFTFQTLTIYNATELRFSYWTLLLNNRFVHWVGYIKVAKLEEITTVAIQSIFVSFQIV